VIYIIESLKIIMFSNTNSHQIQKIVSGINALKSHFLLYMLSYFSNTNATKIDINQSIQFAIANHIG